MPSTRFPRFHEGLTREERGITVDKQRIAANKSQNKDSLDSMKRAVLEIA